MQNISLVTVLTPATLLKRESNTGTECVLLNIPKVLGTAFFMEQFRWLLLIMFQYQKIIFKEES